MDPFLSGKAHIGSIDESEFRGAMGVNVSSMSHAPSVDRIVKSTLLIFAE